MLTHKSSARVPIIQSMAKSVNLNSFMKASRRDDLLNTRMQPKTAEYTSGARTTRQQKMQLDEICNEISNHHTKEKNMNFSSCQSRIKMLQSASINLKSSALMTVLQASKRNVLLCILSCTRRKLTKTSRESFSAMTSRGWLIFSNKVKFFYMSEKISQKTR
jgi:hypothetical protein